MKKLTPDLTIKVLSKALTAIWQFEDRILYLLTSWISYSSSRADVTHQLVGDAHTHRQYGGAG
jgi:hypothetical protein